jgi:hypothetical protein
MEEKGEDCCSDKNLKEHLLVEEVSDELKQIIEIEKI